VLVLGKLLLLAVVLLSLIHVDVFFVAGFFLHYSKSVLLGHVEVSLLAAFDVVLDPFDFEPVGVHLTLIVLELGDHFLQLF